MSKKLLASFIVVIALVALIINVMTNKPASIEGNKLKVATSFKPLSDIVSEVAQDKIEIVTILPEGSSPHTYEPLASDQQKLIGSKLAFVIGQELDNWAVPMLDSATPGVKLVDLSSNITLLASTDADEPGNDPHYWLSYTNASILTGAIATELCSIDQSNCSFYQNNATAFKTEIDQAKSASLKKLTQIKSKQLITFHAAFQYFAKDLGLEIVTTIEPFPGQEPTPQYLAEVGYIIKQYNIKTLFREPQLSDAVVSALASDYGATIKTLNPEGDKDKGYLEMMTYNVDTIVEALK